MQKGSGICAPQQKNGRSIDLTLHCHPHPRELKCLYDRAKDFSAACNEPIPRGGNRGQEVVKVKCHTPAVLAEEYEGERSEKGGYLSERERTTITQTNVRAVARSFSSACPWSTTHDLVSTRFRSVALIFICAMSSLYSRLSFI